MMWLAAMRIRAACDHVLHANSTLVDRVDLATPLSLSSQRLPAPRLLLPRSGLSRSDFVLWHFSADYRRPLWRRVSEGKRTRSAHYEFVDFDPKRTLAGAKARNAAVSRNKV